MSPQITVSLPPPATPSWAERAERGAEKRRPLQQVPRRARHLFTHSQAPLQPWIKRRLCPQAWRASGRTMGEEAALGREGDWKERRRKLLRVLVLSPFVWALLGLEIPGAPGGGRHMVPSRLPKKKNRTLLWERRGPRAQGGGEWGDVGALQKPRRRPPYLSPPQPHHPLSWLLQPLGGEPPSAPASGSAPDEIRGWGAPGDHMLSIKEGK